VEFERKRKKSQDKQRSCPALKIQSPRVNHFLSFPKKKTKQNKTKTNVSRHRSPAPAAPISARAKQPLGIWAVLGTGSSCLSHHCPVAFESKSPCWLEVTMLSTAPTVILSISRGWLHSTNFLIDASVLGDLRNGKSERARRVVRVLGKGHQRTQMDANGLNMVEVFQGENNSE